MTIDDFSPDPVTKEADRRLLDGALARLGATGSPLLRNLADDVRAGRITLADLARRPELAEPFTAAVNRYQMWNRGLTDGEREVLLEEMDRRVRRMHARVAEEWADDGGEGAMRGS